MFIAIAPIGKEFVYRSRTRLEVSEKNVDKILEILNRTGYHLAAGEVWHSYDGGYGDVTYGTAKLDRQGNVRISWEALP